MSLPFHWLHFHPVRASTRLWSEVSLFPLRLSAKVDQIQYQKKSNCMNLLWWSSMMFTLRWYEKYQEWSSTAGKGLLFRWYAPVSWRGWGKRETEIGGENIGESSSVPPHHFSDSIPDWNYLWSGKNSSFDFEPVWPKRETIRTKMQLMKLFGTPGSEKCYERDDLQLWEDWSKPVICCCRCLFCFSPINDR